VHEVNWVALSVFVVLFAFITWLGFAAAHWRKGDLDQLHEWGLAGRRFGTLITWFLVGGDLYTAYTFIAVPALAFGAGAVAFFAVPYTIVVYPLLFLVFPRLWHVCQDLKPAYPLKLGGWSLPGYTAFYTLLLNLAIAVLLTWAFNALGTRRPVDATVATDYHA
jgi:Na+/proline symporter